MVKAYKLWLVVALTAVLSGCFEAGECGSCGEVIEQCLTEGRCVSDQTVVCSGQGREAWLALSTCVDEACRAECEGIVTSGALSSMCRHHCFEAEPPPPGEPEHQPPCEGQFNHCMTN